MDVNVWILFLWLFSLCFAAKEPPQVTVPNQGILMGKEVQQIRTQKIITYLGIPYAQPPVESLRFAPPVTDPLPAWDGVRNASDYAPACLQTKEGYKERDLPFLHLLSDLTFETSEDCLYLNVFVPYGEYKHESNHKYELESTNIRGERRVLESANAIVLRNRLHIKK